MAYKPARALTDEEFLHQFRLVVRRLDIHLSLIDEGNYDVRNDLAGILRTLTTHGKGDDGIRRLISRFSLSPPVSTISNSATNGEGFLFAIGALPDDSPGAKVVTVPDELMKTVAVFVRGPDGTRLADWADVVTDYGNTFGAHLSTTVPQLLDDVHYFGLTETDFGAYMLRSLGVLISSSCHQLLVRLDEKHIPRTHDPYMAGTQIFSAIYLREDGKDDLRVQLRRAHTSKAGAIMTVRNPEGRKLELSITNDNRLRLIERS